LLKNGKCYVKGVFVDASVLLYTLLEDKDPDVLRDSREFIHAGVLRNKYKMVVTHAILGEIVVNLSLKAGTRSVTALNLLTEWLPNVQINPSPISDPSFCDILREVKSGESRSGGSDRIHAATAVFSELPFKVYDGPLERDVPTINKNLTHASIKKRLSLF
jgi:predicted nucleic acid-binding protein